MHSAPPKTFPGARNIKMGSDALGTAKNESGRAKLENGTRRPWNRRKTSPRAQNKKTGPDALGTAENESGHVKHENETRCPQYRRK
jgi:hypothetical protein